VTRLCFVAASLSLVAGCATDGKDGTDGTDGTNGTNGMNGSDGPTGPQGPPGPELAPPAVYTSSNAVAGNQIESMLRASNGGISRDGHFDTSGAGTDGGLGSQGALVYDAKSGRFFAVNAGDDSISMLGLDADGKLELLSAVPSGGKRPVSVTVRDGIVYVANQGDLAAATVGANISGFRVTGDNLVAIASSTQPLSATTDVRPTDIAFTPDGARVIVAERFANKLDTFELVTGVAQPGAFHASAGMQPFAFDFSPEGFLVVAEVGPGAANGSTASSYQIGNDGTLTPVTSALPTFQTAACWLVMAGGHAFVANAASANITGLDVSETGALSLHDASGITATTGAGAIDLAVTPDRGYLYSLSSGTHTIHIFAINSDGSLTAQPAFADLPAAAAGLVAR
jgi:6-phosphogluconolactonase (cycloisomerase 2 family)